MPVIGGLRLMLIRAAILGLLAALTAGPLAAADQPELSQSKAKTAQIVALARLGSVVCPQLEADEDAMHQVMQEAGITDSELVDPKVYGQGNSVVQRSFVQSFLSDPNTTCINLFAAFGPGRGQLLRRAGKPI